MKPFKIALISLLTLIMLSGCGGAIDRVKSFFAKESLEDPGVTAKQWVPYVEDVAKKWREDAQLFGIINTPITEDGRSQQWKYMFYSEGGDKSVLVSYDHGFISIKEREVTPLKSISKWEIDSPIAVQVAMIDGGGAQFMSDNNRFSITAALISYPKDKRYRNKTAYWSLTFYGDRDTFEVQVDAVSGKIIN